MRSQYSPRLYELLKSYAWKRKWTLDIEELKKRLGCENYSLFGDFKRCVLSIALKEINELSDIAVEYVIIKNGRKFTHIEFIIKPVNDINERTRTYARIEDILDPPQMSMFDSYDENTVIKLIGKLKIERGEGFTSHN